MNSEDRRTCRRLHLCGFSVTQIVERFQYQYTHYIVKQVLFGDGGGLVA